MLIDVTGTVRIGAVMSCLNRLQRFDFKKVFKRLRKPMHKDQADHRDKQRGPRAAWPPLAATTRARYARLGYRRNRRILNRLPNARQTLVTAQELRMKSRVPWSMAHQNGPTRVGRGSILPQRQFLWISSSLRAEARKEFRRAMLHGFMGWKYP
jgi:hypothetical protein